MARRWMLSKWKTCEICQDRISHTTICHQNVFKLDARMGDDPHKFAAEFANNYFLVLILMRISFSFHSPPAVAFVFRISLPILLLTLKQVTSVKWKKMKIEQWLNCAFCQPALQLVKALRRTVNINSKCYYVFEFDMTKTRLHIWFQSICN